MGRGTKGNLSDLRHTRRPLVNGGHVTILDTGAVIDAEAEAMLQALHSHSTGGLDHHLGVLQEKGASDFMGKFYVGYGHKSIGDCGTATAFIEGVSMLAAKAVQDSPLYNGQESSTRYVDFSRQPVYDPTDSSEGEEILESQRVFYLASLEPIREDLRKKHPRADGEKETVYEKAINARSFDIARAFLPAGMTTNLAWHTTLRNATDRLTWLRHHPLVEVKRLAQTAGEAFSGAYFFSFDGKTYPDTEDYQDEIAAAYFYHDVESPADPLVDFGNVDFKELEAHRALFDGRPQKTELPKFLGHIGTVGVRYTLDFGSFRDIQRHRAINQRMPLLTPDLGFNDWYVESLPASVAEKLDEHLGSIVGHVKRLGVSPEEAQYFFPMGFNTANKFVGDIPSTVYMVELRDTRFVHPILQRVAHTIGNKLENKLGIPLHRDSEPGRFDVRRGEQDIILKDG